MENKIIKLSISIEGDKYKSEEKYFAYKEKKASYSFVEKGEIVLIGKQ